MTDICRACKKEIPEESPCIMIECGMEFYEKHPDSDALMCWHISCFENKIGMKLPKFKAKKELCYVCQSAPGTIPILDDHKKICQECEEKRKAGKFMPNYTCTGP